VQFDRTDLLDSLADADLIAEIDAGNARAFDALYHRYRDWVARLARRFTGHDEDALDVLQETFAYVHRKFPGFTLTCAMTSFLWPVVRNLSLQARRKRMRSLAIGDADLDLPDTHRSITASDEGILDLVKRLTPDQRQLILMRFVDDLTQEEIAHALRVPIGTVKSRLHAAITQLRGPS
jgi:RNA polymerase sigma-70 factor, ECF subfamily